MKKIMLIILPSLLVFCCSSRIDTALRDGDLIFHESKSNQGEELKLATGSRYTHMGIVYKMRGKFYVYEAVQPVKLTSLHAFIARGKGRHYVVKRLINAEYLLTREGVKKMRKTGAVFLGRNYDDLFQWSDTRIYCSELVWKIYKRSLGVKIGNLQKFKDFDLSHPKVKALVKKRYGNKVPLDEQVISPAQMFKSQMLVTVISN